MLGVPAAAMLGVPAAAMLGVLAAALLGATGCGDDLEGDAPPLAPADRLVIVAHLDDDLIFMQPEIHDAVASGSVTTVYVSSGDPVKGNGVAANTFTAAMMAYTSAAGSHDWVCGYGTVAGSPIHHCRLRDRPVSMIGLDTADGGTDGQFPESPLHLVEGQVPSIQILGQLGGRATVDSITAELAEIIAATAPSQIDTLDLAATHGSDHSGHMFAATFALWAAARVRYDGPIRWHRGYNVDNDLPNLPEADYLRVKPMLGYFEACYFGCGPCGTSCATLTIGHDTDLQRQYSTPRDLPAGAAPALEGDGRCATVSAAGAVVLGDCAGGAVLRLEADGHLVVDQVAGRLGAGMCLASAAGNDEPAVLAPCEDTPAQYWVADGDGLVWNGLPPQPAADMAHDHVRCLSPGASSADAAGGASPSPLTVPVCGARVHPRWRFGAQP